jgi:uncharacterized protein RhaS with RHS repeats
MNLYAYVDGDPINLVDPEGLYAGTLTWGTWGTGIVGTILIAIPEPTTTAIGTLMVLGTAATIAGDTVKDDTADDEQCKKGKWMCEGYGQYEIIGANKHVIRGDKWIVAYGNTQGDASLAWKKQVQAAAPKGHTARHIKPRCKKIK